jgi:hypothetical protein
LVSIYSLSSTHTLRCAESSRSLFKDLINSFLFTPALNPEAVFWICVSFSADEKLSLLAFQGRQRDKKNNQFDKKGIRGDIQIMKLRYLLYDSMEEILQKLHENIR